jgi:hypothetical protein
VENERQEKTEEDSKLAGVNLNGGYGRPSGKMLRKMVCALMIAGTVACIVGIVLLPQQPSTVTRSDGTPLEGQPPRVNIIASTGFILSMVGGACIISSLVYLVITRYYYQEEAVVPQPVESIIIHELQPRPQTSYKATMPRPLDII